MERDEHTAIEQNEAVPMSDYPSLDELIWLFESDPSMEYEDLDYPVSATTFETNRGAHLVQCTVEPYTNSVSICLEHDGAQVVSLTLDGMVEEAHIDRVHGEALVLSTISSLPFRQLRLELKPRLLLTWSSIPPWV